MSKLSGAVKTLINASHASPGLTPASAQVKPALASFARAAADNKVGLPAWVTVSTAVSATMNCPDAMLSILELANAADARRAPADNAALVREVGLKCISFNGIPRSINTLNAFAAGLPPEVADALPATPTRDLTPANVEARKRDGLALWDSVYLGFERKLLAKLARSHPDLPVHILNGHYSNLLSNPSGGGDAPASSSSSSPVGRVLTSLVAISCLRAQTGVGPQVVSHIFGLRKAYAQDGGPGEHVEGGEWLAGDEGNLWMLEGIDGLVGAIGQGQGTTFAPGIGARL